LASIILYGAGSPILGDVVDSCLRLDHSVAAIVQNLIDAPPFDARNAVVRPEDLTPEHFEMSFSIPLFNPANRQRAFNEAFSLGARKFTPIVDPTSVLPEQFMVADGTYVAARVVLGSEVRLGAFAFVNRGALIGHHVTMEGFVSVGPGANLGSFVHVGQGAMIGTGAVVATGIKIGDGATVGAGAVVIRDVAEGTIVFGNPARVTKNFV
jgi:sugar O-acyltransferase (sialic acid O-acetyltransferase NeuD family)